VRESVEENRSREVEEYVRAIGSSRAGEAARNSSADDLATSWPRGWDVWLRRPSVGAHRRIRRITRTRTWRRRAYYPFYPRVRAHTCRTHTRAVRYRATLRRPFALVARLFGGLASHRLPPPISHPLDTSSSSFDVVFDLSRHSTAKSPSFSRRYQRHRLRRCSRVALKKSHLSFFSSHPLFPRVEIF